MAAGDNHFQYINLPAHKTFEWGYNPHHDREENLSKALSENLDVKAEIPIPGAGR